MNAINLIPMPRQHAAQQQRAVRRWVGICCGYVALIVVAAAICFAADQSTTPANQQMEPIAAEITRANAELVSVRSQSATEKRKLQLIMEVSDQPNWSVLLRVVSGLLGDSIVLENVSIAPAREEAAATTAVAKDAKAIAPPVKPKIALQLAGIGRSQGAITELVLRLEGLHLFERVDLVQTAPRSLRSSEGVAFRIACGMDGDGK